LQDYKIQNYGDNDSKKTCIKNDIRQVVVKKQVGNNNRYQQKDTAKTAEHQQPQNQKEANPLDQLYFSQNLHELNHSIYKTSAISSDGCSAVVKVEYLHNY
jgi:hypothetical protein